MLIFGIVIVICITAVVCTSIVQAGKRDEKIAEKMVEHWVEEQKHGM